MKTIRRTLSGIFAATWLMGLTACATDGNEEDEKDIDEITKGEDAADEADATANDGEDGADDGEDGGEDATGASDGEDGEDGADADDGEDGDVDADGSLTDDCEDEDCETSNLVDTDPPAPEPTAFGPEPDPVPVTPPVETPQTPPKQQSGYVWVPNNDGARPAPITQADLNIVCQKIGPGYLQGYVRYGCKSYKRDGQHYGIVKGWWRVLRRDGARAKTKDLNFREAGFDMAFDVYGPDAAAGVVVKPGWGEQAPLRAGR